jgi:DNA-binding CsgD family transcriptional regulator
LPACVPALERVVGEGEAVGAVGCVVHARWLLGFSAFWRGDWDDAQAHFDAGLALCGPLGLSGLRWPGVAGLGLVAAGRGEVGSALAYAAEITAWATPRGAKAIAGYASGIVAMKAVSEGDFEAAFDAAAAFADLPSTAPRLALLTAAAAAMTGPVAEAGALFERALRVPDAESWVFEHACVRFAFGAHLRRDRCARRAREQLRLALAVFERLGAAPWVARAQAELAATGERRTRADDPDAPLLTPQELEIARLAAQGLSNKEIGTRVHLSHRTVSTHLYRIFPRLGITSRMMLRDALARLDQG